MPKWCFCLPLYLLYSLPFREGDGYGDGKGDSFITFGKLFRLQQKDIVSTWEGAFVKLKDTFFFQFYHETTDTNKKKVIWGVKTRNPAFFLVKTERIGRLHHDSTRLSSLLPRRDTVLSRWPSPAFTKADEKGGLPREKKKGRLKKGGQQRQGCSAVW